jgi:hypothetical protein
MLIDCFVSLIFTLSLFKCISLTLDGVELCQDNCISSDRIVGPTQLTTTREHPYKIAPFPPQKSEFCKMGCQLFFTDRPTNVTCKKSCEYTYRYQVIIGSNLWPLDHKSCISFIVHTTSLSFVSIIWCDSPNYYFIDRNDKKNQMQEW